jgi:O-antigen/teichoic acid export membrane protein
MTSQLSLGLAVSSPVMIFLGSGLRVVIAADITYKYLFGEYFSVRMILNLLGFFVIYLFAKLSNYEAQTIQVILLVGIAKYLEGLQEICWGVMQRKEIMKPIGISRILRGLGMVASIALGLIVFQSLAIGVIFWLLCWLVILIFYDLPNARRLEKIRLKWVPKVWIKIVAYSAPLAFVWGILALNEKVPVYLLSWLKGENIVGYFTPLSYILQVGGMAMSTVTESMIPRLALLYQTNRNSFFYRGVQLAGLGAFLGVMIFIVSLLGGGAFLRTVYSAEYLPYLNVFVTLMGASIVRFSLAGIGASVTAAGIYRVQIPIFLIQMFITVVTGWMLIPKLGLMGAALSTGAGLLVAFVCLLVVLIRARN